MQPAAGPWPSTYGTKPCENPGSQLGEGRVALASMRWLSQTRVDEIAILMAMARQWEQANRRSQDCLFSIGRANGTEVAGAAFVFAPAAQHEVDTDVPHLPTTPGASNR